MEGGYYTHYRGNLILLILFLGCLKEFANFKKCIKIPRVWILKRGVVYMYAKMKRIKLRFQKKKRKRKCF